MNRLEASIDLETFLSILQSKLVNTRPVAKHFYIFFSKANIGRPY